MYHEGKYVLIHNVVIDMLQTMCVNATKLLNLECKSTYLCFIGNVMKVKDKTSGDYVDSYHNLKEKVREDYQNLFRLELLACFPPHRNVEQKI